jgi:hypothetical protein
MEMLPNQFMASRIRNQDDHGVVGDVKMRIGENDGAVLVVVDVVR